MTLTFLSPNFHLSVFCCMLINLASACSLVIANEKNVINSIIDADEVQFSERMSKMQLAFETVTCQISYLDDIRMT